MFLTMKSKSNLFCISLIYHYVDGDWANIKFTQIEEAMLPFLRSKSSNMPDGDEMQPFIEESMIFP